MSYEPIEFLSAVIIVSENPKRLFEFYQNILGIPLKPEDHGEKLSHYGCSLGDIHFAIHPIENFLDRRSGVGSVKIAFNVFDIKALIHRLSEMKVTFFYPLQDKGLFLTVAIEDPDGNYIEFTQLIDEWFEWIEEKRTKGSDIISRWKQNKRNLPY